MCSRRFAGWLLGVLLSTIAPAATAQTPEEQALLERLSARLERLSGRSAAADSLARLPHDTVRVGSVLILTDSGRTPLLRAGAAAMEAALVGAFGTPAPAVLDGARIVVRFGPPQAAWGALLSGDTQFIQVLRGRTTEDRLAAALSHALNTILWLRSGPGVRDWHADLRLVGTAPDQLWRTTFTELLTSTVPHALGCFQGDLRACREALRLSETPQVPADTAALRRYVESEFRSWATQPRFADGYVRCTERGDAAACSAFIARAGFEIPGLSSRTRGTLLLHAREQAGPEAYSRFFDDSTSAVTLRLERASGQPLDSLLAGWHATIMAHRPQALTTSAGLQWLSIGWIVVLVALATRSTRWR